MNVFHYANLRTMRTTALYELLAFVAAKCTPEGGLNETWSFTACDLAKPLIGADVVQADGHQTLVGYDGVSIVVAFRGSLSIHLYR